LDEDMRAGASDIDPRLGLLFACAHPAIDAGVRTALMLQTVLGFTAQEIARAFMMEPATLSQRLVRAKAKLKAAGLRFAAPDVDVWPERLNAVLEAIYACYGAGYDDAARHDLAHEALYLSELLAALLPGAAEVLGLRALVLHVEARAPARRDNGGAYVPLSAQDPKTWRADLIAEAERTLRAAQALKSVGRFQLEAAIQSAYAARAWRGVADYDALLVLYDGLLRIAPSDVVRLNRAAVLAEAHGASAAMSAIAPLEHALNAYQPFWALKADLSSRVGDHGEARAAYGRAIALCTDAAMKQFLERKSAAL
jgi:RNA polymerase sigma-70 factor (ECF subfamily)